MRHLLLDALLRECRPEGDGESVDGISLEWGSLLHSATIFREVAVDSHGILNATPPVIALVVQVVYGTAVEVVVNGVAIVNFTVTIGIGGNGRCGSDVMESFADLLEDSIIR